MDVKGLEGVSECVVRVGIWSAVYVLESGNVSGVCSMEVRMRPERWRGEWRPMGDGRRYRH